VQQLVLLRYLFLQVGPCLFVPPLEKDGEKYVLLVRRKICTCGPAKNMHFWSGEKYALVGRRKICSFLPAKNMSFWAGEKYVLLVRRKICTFGTGLGSPDM
jgi:hypothetical protein